MKELKILTRDGAEIKILYFSAQTQNAPLLLEVHGGGFVYGSAADDVKMCKKLSSDNGVNVASIDYRLAPEYVYPVATDDCEDALKALIVNAELHFDRKRIAVLGSSAGANIAAGLSFRVKSSAEIKGQILLYPFLNALENKRKYVFSSFMRAELKKFNDKYFPDKKRRGEFVASPLKGSAEEIKGLPPALIFTAGIDTLAPDGAQYAELLRGAGVQCTHIHEPLARHGYFEVVPNGKIDKWWWAGKKSCAEQHRCYKAAHAQIKMFLNQIFTEN